MKQKNVLQQQLYTVAFVDLSIKMILDSSNLIQRPEWLDTIFLLVFFGCIGWKISLQKYTKPLLLGTVVFGAIFAFVSFKMKYFFLLFTFCGVAAAQNIELKKVFRYTSITKVLLILLHVAPHIITAMVMPEQIDYVYRNGVQRQYFYLGHPNTFSMYVGWAVLEFIYAFYEQLKRRDFAIFWLVNYIVYLFTDSNTSLIVMTICTVGFLAERANPSICYKVLKPLSSWAFALCSVFFTVITMWFTSMPTPIKSLYLLLNKFFTGRLMYGAFAYEHFGIGWLGNTKVGLSQTTYFEGIWVDKLIFDNSYIYLLVYYGAIFLPIFSLAFIITGRDKKQDLQRNPENVLLIGYAFYAVMEQYAINAVLCFPILFVGKRMFDMYEESRRLRKKASLGEKHECNIECSDTGL